MPTPVPTTPETLDAFMTRVRASNLDASDRRTLIDQATIVLESFYAHLPAKRVMLGVDPVQQLRTLRIPLLNASGKLHDDYPFHEQMLRVFATMRDIHTLYHLPPRYGLMSACLPIVIESFGPDGDEHYLVTKVLPHRNLTLEPGAEVTHWNGTPIARMIERLAETTPGSNRASQRWMALNSLTIRPLGMMPRPDEDWVELEYKDKAVQKPLRQTLKWEVLPNDVAQTALRDDGVEVVPARSSIDQRNDAIRRLKAWAFARPASEQKCQQVIEKPYPLPKNSPFAEHLRAARLHVRNEDCGYLRIFSFNVDDAQMSKFVETVSDILGWLKVKRLIVDVRGNSGGAIALAERVLRLFRHDITGERAQLVASPVMFEFFRGVAAKQPTQFKPIEAALQQAIEVGATYARGFPVSPAVPPTERFAPFDGKVVLVVDAGSLSATDVFAAGFQDHDIGPILGTGPSTGGAGAAKHTHEGVRQSFAATAGSNSPLVQLPDDVSISMAFQRLIRVLKNVDVPLEGFGVSVSEQHEMTENDLLCRNVDLIGSALDALRKWEEAHGGAVTA